MIASCASTSYVAPRIDQPHAELRVRRRYEAIAGELLVEGVRINGSVAFRNTVVSGAARGEHADVMLIRPGAARIDIAGAFSHAEIQTVDRPFVPPVSRVTEVSSCGHQTCLRSDRDPSMTNQPTSRPLDVVDAWCEKTLFVAPAVAGVYVIDFTYHDDRVCSVACAEVVPGVEPSTRPCPTPSEAQMRQLANDD